MTVTAEGTVNPPDVWYLEIRGPSADTNAFDRWCARLTSQDVSGVVPWSAFGTLCFNNAAPDYQLEPIVSVMAIVGADSSATTAFDFCMTEIALAA
jgi:hypothetical protein